MSDERRWELVRLDEEYAHFEMVHTKKELDAGINHGVLMYPADIWKERGRPVFFDFVNLRLENSNPKRAKKRFLFLKRN